MTWGTDQKPTTNIDATTVAHTNDLRDLAPGKRTAIANGNYTGNAYADHGATCEADPKGAGCFLPVEVRRKLIEASLIPKITNVSNTYQRACDMVRVERLLRSEAPLPMIIGVFLDLIGLRLGFVISGELLKMRDAITRQAHALEISPSGVGGINPIVLTQLVSLAVGRAKTQVISGLAMTPNEQKKQAIELVKQIQQAASVGFEALWQDIPAYATDPELIAYDEAFSAKHHDQAVYEGLISDKIDRLMATVMQIGRSPVPASEHNHPQAWIDGKNPHANDVRVSWAKFLSGFPRKLMFEHIEVTGPDVNEDKQPKLSQGEMNPGLPGGDNHHYRFVDDDLVDAAVQRHLAVWGDPPLEVDVDDSGWYWDPPRMTAAQNNKNSPTKKLQLGPGPTMATPVATKDSKPVGWMPDFAKKGTTP